MSCKYIQSWARRAPVTPRVVQVRIQVERSLGLAEGSLSKDSKARLKEAVHSVMVRAALQDLGRRRGEGGR